MSGKSIAGMAAAIKQRQKIAYSSGYWKRLAESRNELEPPKISNEIMTCPSCGFQARYKFLRCPSCNQ